MPLPIPELTGHTYTHTETTYPIRYYFPLCAKSARPLIASVEHGIQQQPQQYAMKFSCESSA